MRYIIYFMIALVAIILGITAYNNSTRQKAIDQAKIQIEYLEETSDEEYRSDFIWTCIVEVFIILSIVIFI